jgi:tetratricopeptide (TPR) repeat protein
LVAATAGIVVDWVGGGHAAWLAAIGVLLIPGRVQGHYYRDLFRGRRSIDEQQYEAGLFYTQRFLILIRERPKLKRLLWLGWPIYTDDAEAMALNNLGAAHLELGEWDAATAAFHEALGLDARYPMPCFNLALLAEAKGERSEAERLFHEAALRGLCNTSIDDLIHRAQSVLARIEGRGAVAPAEE